MDHAQLKEILYQRIEVAEPELLQRMFDLSEGVLPRRFEGRTSVSDGAPADAGAIEANAEPALRRLSREELTAELNSAIRSIEDGRFTDLETLEREMQTWGE